MEGKARLSKIITESNVVRTKKKKKRTSLADDRSRANEPRLDLYPCDHSHGRGFLFVKGWARGATRGWNVRGRRVYDGNDGNERGRRRE